MPEMLSHDKDVLDVIVQAVIFGDPSKGCRVYIGPAASR